MILNCKKCGKEFITYPYFKGYRFSRARRNGKRYIQIYMPKHPFASKAGYVREQRLIMEKHLGRSLTKDEVVHHKDGNTLNNDITNLELLTWKEHRQLHTKDSIHERWVLNSLFVNS